MTPEITLFNTATLSIEPLQARGGRATLYVCGVTPYDTTHAGHAFTYVTFDALRRVLQDAGITVQYTQNVTDIDDDILRKSAELGVPYDELAERETELYLADMASLNVATPHSYVKATDAIPDIVTAVEELVRGGIGYQSGGNVYFDNRAFSGYGALCHCDREHMLALAAEHGGFPDDPAKRDPLDFLLWQGHKPGEPSWPSPFGAGRPGWHIECSTIAMITLGLPVTIHGGGRDLIFPHHASEIAQAESVHKVSPFAEHWMHTAMVRYQGEKMSKSLGNLVLVRDLLRRYSADAIRLYLLSHHYREEFEYDEGGLADAAVVVERLRGVVAGASDVEGADNPVIREMRDLLWTDLDIPRVIARMVDHLDGSGSAGPSSDVVAGLRWISHVLGLTLSSRAEVQVGCAT